jgi:hypothetical protein
MNIQNLMKDPVYSDLTASFSRRVLATMAGFGLSVAVPAGAEIPIDQLEFFESKIRPIFVENCLKCHSTETKQKGGLILDSRQGWMAGGDTGPALVPGDPEASLILKALSYEDPDLQMPPKKRLSKADIETMHQWIAMGAPDPREGTAPTAQVEDFDLEKRAGEHWAWQPRGNPASPKVANGEWAKTDIDRFILRRLEHAGLTPSKRADKRVLARRLYFDLIGLPPTAREVEAFVTNDSPDAYGELVADLLTSPHFGEKWGQHWLDLVRYAETRGHEADYPIPEAWKYRDYVIRAFNADVPYDQLLIEHIAGDLVEDPRIDPERRTNESIQGTGFWHLGEATHSPVDIREDECTRVANQIDVFSKAFQSVTVGCARCHDHKFDAISTKDYYAMFGYLQSSSLHLADVSDPVAQETAHANLQELSESWRQKLLKGFSEEFSAGKETFARSLVAAREALQSAVTTKKTKDDKGKEKTETIFDDEAIGKLAGQRRLNQETLERLVRVLQQQGQDPHGLFYVFAAFPEERDHKIRCQKITDVWQQRNVESIKRIAALEVLRSDAKGEGNYVKTRRAFDPAKDVIADYGDLDANEWITSGYRFGQSPSHPGDLQVSGDPKSPSIRLLSESAAHSDLGSAKFSGMIRTKTFEVTSDKIWIRFLGKADLFLAVDSHRVCQGPLHNSRLKKNLDGGMEFGWIAHDVHKYIGHRVHLEFTPPANGDFALSQIQFGENEPVDMFDPNPVLSGLARPDIDQSMDGIAKQLIKGLEVTFRHVLENGNAEAASFAYSLLDQVLQFRDFWKPESNSEVTLLLAEYLEKKDEIESTIPVPDRAISLLDGSAENEPVHVRGNYRTLAPDAVPRRFLTALGGAEFEAPAKRGSGRLELAKQVASADNPLTARVITNRIWHYLFGRGIVPTVDNFGSTGQPPSHPELLDYLANEFVENGWSIKKTIREVVLSSTYQQSSKPNLDNAAIDPTNTLLYRMPIRRLTAESVRDSLLAVSGRLDRKQFGKSVMVHITPFMRNNRSPGGSGPLDGNGRRSIYIEGRRNHLEPLLLAFDKPTPFTAIGRRNVSNSPAQPLILLNNPLVHDQARLWAKSLIAETANDSQRIENAYLTAFARPPADWEKAAALEFLTQQAAKHGESKPEEESWTDLAHTLFNVKEFIFLN